MNAATQPPSSPPGAARRQSILGLVSLGLGLLTLLAILVTLIARLIAGPQSATAIILWASVAPAGLGMALAVAGLLQENRARDAAHYGLWINGTIAILIVPIALASSLL